MKCVLFLAGIATVLVPASAQVGRSPTINPGNASTPSIPNTGTRFPQPGTTTIPTQPGPAMPQPVYVSGKVVMDDGTPPPTPVVMKVLCRSNPRSFGYTDSKGHFYLDLADRNEAAQIVDVSDPGGPFGGGSLPAGVGEPRGMSNSQFAGCEIFADLAGFRSDRITLDVRHGLDNPEIGTLVLHRMANVEGLTISATTAMAPKDAKKAFEKGISAEHKQKWAEAEKDFDSAVDKYPKFAEAWYHLGRAQEAQKDRDGARKSYAKALEADSKLVSPYERLAAMALEDQNWEEAAEDSSKVVKLNPVDFPVSYLYNALANFNLHKLDLAEKSARDGVAADTGHQVPRLSYVLGIVLAQKQDYAGAVDNLRAYLTRVPNGPDANLIRNQLAEAEHLAHPEAAKQAPSGLAK